MRLNGKPTTRLIVQLFTPAKLPDDTRCDTRRLHIYGLLPPSVARILRWQQAALYGRSTSNRKTMETTSTVHRLLDGPWAAACTGRAIKK